MYILRVLYAELVATADEAVCAVDVTGLAN